ncbi:MAG TPA: MBL fold metallo-hydrolase, partial [Verrucomicrobiae bacterium]|nr:MBL fold metallo-hydrolase [Verrucomicrobiae bacterium]
MDGRTLPEAPDRPEASAAAILTLETPELGDRSYLVHDGSLAVAIDPQRDLDRILEAAGAAGVRIGLVVETHLHNDYVTGGLELARRTGSPYVIGG